MSTTAPHIPSQQILALNNAETSENKIHSDDIANKYGFKGALVSGVNVFGYLSQPLVKFYGEDWLQSGVMDVIFLKPAYQDDLLSLQTESIGSETSIRNHQTCAYNEDNVLLAKLESWLPERLPEANELAVIKGPTAETGEQKANRQEISWNLIKLNEAAPEYLWQPREEDNAERVSAQRDQSSIYKGADGFIHPYYLLDACNKCLMRMFIVPAWIHTGSKLVLRKPLRVGQDIMVQTIPIDKWEHKGHQFIKLYISMWTDKELALEAEHTAIFKIAE